MASEDSPYYISSSDCTTEILCKFSLSPDGKNYLLWSKCMSSALRCKNKRAFIDGTLPPPEKDSPHFSIWTRCDALVMSWICNGIGSNSSLYKSAIYAKSAKDLWDDLHQMFYRGTPIGIYEITSKIRGLRQGRLTVEKYYTKLATLWSELDCYMAAEVKDCTCECGASAAYKKLKDNERLFQFLMGLDSAKFRTAKFQIFSSESLPSLRKAYQMVVLEEQLNDMRI